MTGALARTRQRIGRLVSVIRRRVAIRTRLRAITKWFVDRLRGVPRVSRPWDRAGYVLASLEVPRTVTVIVIVPEDTSGFGRCLASVLRNTRKRGVRLVVVDDASMDPSVTTAIVELADVGGVTVLRHPRRLGYSESVRDGLAEAQGDVVILDGDVEVPPRWLDNLLVAAHQDPRIGSVTPLSSRLRAVGRWFDARDVPHLDPDDLGRLVSQASSRRYPTSSESPQPPVLVKRAALDVEPDIAGILTVDPSWLHVIDDATYLDRARPSPLDRSTGRHAGSELLTVGTRSRGANGDLAEVGRDISRAVERSVVLHRTPGARVLFVLHDAVGGTHEAAFDLMRSVRPHVDPFVLVSDAQQLTLRGIAATGTVDVARWRLRSPVWADEFRREDYQEVVLTLLVEHAIELVHIHHLIGHTFDLPRVAGALGIPVVLSFHDYYFSCPTVQLLDDQLRFCGGRCTAGQGECRVATPWLQGLPHLKHGWVEVWRREVGNMFDHVDAFVAPTSSAAQVYRRSFPRFERDDIHIIEHGRRSPRPLEPSRTVPPEVTGDTRRIVIAVPGNLDVHKGSTFIRRLAEIDQERRLEFHFFGRPDPSLDGIGVQHGVYERDDLVRELQELQPDLVGLFSVTAETYSYTLTEAWTAGIPVVATDLGAFRERISTHGGGWLVDPHDPEAAYQRISRVVDETEEYRRVRSSIPLRHLPTSGDTARQYRNLYRELLADRTIGGRTHVERTERLRVGLVLPAGEGGFLPVTHIRMLRPFGHPGSRRDIRSRILDAEDLLRGSTSGLDLVVVQRNAVPADRIEPFLSSLREEQVRLVFDLDDDLFELIDEHPDDGEYGPHLRSLRRLVTSADLVTVSTDVLAERLEGRAAGRLAVVPNQLDEHLWFQQPVEPRPRDRERTFRLVYVGSPTHAEDLELLRPVMERLSARGIELDVVGIPGEGSGEDPWRRIALPDGAGAYPAFVQWLKRQRDRWDAAVAPLRDTAFNRAKSDLKFLEYAALGLPGVYSDLDPYRTVQDGVTGLTVPDDPEGWIRALSQLRADRELGRSIAERARTYVQAERCLGSGDHLERYIGLLERVAAAD